MPLDDFYWKDEEMWNEEMWKEVVRDRLIEIARQGGKITYEEVADLMGLRLRNPNHQYRLSHILGKINEDEKKIRDRFYWRRIYYRISHPLLAGRPRSGYPGNFFKE